MQTLEQQARAWLDSRQKLLELTVEWDRQGLSFNEDPCQTDPDSIAEPLRSEVLRLLSMTPQSPKT